VTKLTIFQSSNIVFGSFDCDCTLFKLTFGAYKDVWTLANEGKGVKERFGVMGFTDPQEGSNPSQHSKGFWND